MSRKKIPTPCSSLAKTLEMVRQVIYNGDLDGERHIGWNNVDKIRETPRQDIIQQEMIGQLKSKEQGAYGPWRQPDQSEQC